MPVIIWGKMTNSTPKGRNLCLELCISLKPLAEKLQPASQL